MRKFTLLVAIAMFSLFSFQAMAQDDGTYIEMSTEKDSSHVEGGVLDFGADFGEEEEAPESGNNSLAIIAVAAVVVAGGGFYVMKKKKK